MRLVALALFAALVLALAPSANAGPAPDVPQVAAYDIHVGVGVSVGPSYRRVRRCYYTSYGRRYCRTRYVRTYRPRRYYSTYTYYPSYTTYPTYRPYYRPYYRRYSSPYYYRYSRPYAYRYSRPYYRSSGSRRVIGRRR